MSQSIYLDYAAATPLDERVLQAMQPYFTDNFYNPSAQYAAARGVANALADARRRAAKVLGAKPVEIIFTAGGTEANNLAFHGVMQQYPGSNQVISAIEHDSVRNFSERYPTRFARVKPDGLVDLAALEKLIDDQTVLVSIMYANNEIGTVQPIREVAQVVEHIKQKRRQSGNKLPLYLHSDACQAGLYLDLHTARLGVDLLSLNGGKIYGPKQSGLLFVKTGTVLQPTILGGGQERGLRSGTENVAAIIGFATALEDAQNNRHAEADRLKKLQQLFIDLISSQLPQAQLNGSLRKRLANNIHLTIPGNDNERLLIGLDYAGIQAAAGSACSASHDMSSHVLRAIGLSDEAARASLRFTMGRGTTEDQIRIVVAKLAELID